MHRQSGQHPLIETKIMTYKNKENTYNRQGAQHIGDLFTEFLHSDQPLAVAIRKAVNDGKMPLTAQTIKTATPLEDWIDAQDVMQALHISPRTLATLRANGTLPFTKLCGRCLYRKSDLEKVLDEHDTMVRLQDPKGYGHSRS